MEINLGERKRLRGFCTRLVDSAKLLDWDNVELGKLLFLLMKELNIKKKKRLKFLRNFNIDSAILKAIVDSDEEIINIDVIFSILKYNALTNEKLIYSVGEAIENDLFDITNLDHLDSLNAAVQDCFDSNEFQEFVKMICENTDTKKDCGKILNFFTSSMHTAEAVRFINDIISFDFFLDLRGNIEDFLNEIIEVKEDLRLFLGNNYLSGRLNGVHGEFIDSDEDEEGNLSGFIVGEDYIGSETDSNSVVSSEDSDTKDDSSVMDSVTDCTIRSRLNGKNSFKQFEQSKTRTNIPSNISLENASPFKRLKRNSNNKYLDNQIPQTTTTTSTTTLTPTKVSIGKCGNIFNQTLDTIPDNNNASSSSSSDKANKKRKSRIIYDDDDVMEEDTEVGEVTVIPNTKTYAEPSKRKKMSNSDTTISNISTSTVAANEYTDSLNTDNTIQSKLLKKKKKTKRLNTVTEPVFADPNLVLSNQCQNSNNNINMKQSSSSKNVPSGTGINNSGETKVKKESGFTVISKKKKKS